MTKTISKSTAVLLLVIAALICVIPLAIINDSEFGGADGEAEDVIMEISPGYEPWFENILEPPGGETESLLFCLQAAIGSGVLFGGLGYFLGTKKRDKAA